jgi:hypothetical protein
VAGHARLERHGLARHDVGIEKRRRDVGTVEQVVHGHEPAHADPAADRDGLRGPHRQGDEAVRGHHHLVRIVREEPGHALERHAYLQRPDGGWSELHGDRMGELWDADDPVSRVVSHGPGTAVVRGVDDIARVAMVRVGERAVQHHAAARRQSQAQLGTAPPHLPRREVEPSTQVRNDLVRHGGVVQGDVVAQRPDDALGTNLVRGRAHWIEQRIERGAGV